MGYRVVFQRVKNACEWNLGHNLGKSISAPVQRDFNLRGLSTPLLLAWLVLALAFVDAGLDSLISGGISTSICLDLIYLMPLEVISTSLGGKLSG
jgi:hypothetical protein